MADVRQDRPTNGTPTGGPATGEPPTGEPPTGERTVLLLLRAPSANRVYAEASGPLAVREAQRVLAAHLGADVTVRAREVAGLDYLEVSAPAPRADVLRIAGTLSGAHGAFAPQETAGRLLLEPVAPVLPFRYGSDLETTLRYLGKTNEQFTALLLNLAASLSERRAGLLDGTLAVLDPMCGRGTTLNRALRLGLSATGADLDRADHEAYRAFLLTWMRTHHLKHTSEAGRLSAHGRVLGSRFTAELAPDKESLRADRRAGRVQRLTLLRCDTAELPGALPAVLPGARFDALVADLPYGVQHGARSGGALSRSPLETLAAAAPGWRSLLRRDAGMALALNRRTARWEDVAQALRAVGFTVASADGEFRHRVDASIERDVILAVRTDHPHAEKLETAARASGIIDPTPSERTSS